jgi:hypothetical protein
VQFWTGFFCGVALLVVLGGLSLATVASVWFRDGNADE